MGTPSLKLDLLRALRSRLELEAGMGVEFIRAPGPEMALLESALGESGKPAQPTRQRQVGPASRAPQPVPIPARPLIPAMREPAAPAAVPGQSVRPASPTAAKAQHLPPGYVSLVPYVAASPCPEREAALAGLREEALCCQACELCAKRTNVAWGEGSLEAEVMFIGEGPGRDEDVEGRPFVGRSGRLLTDIIEKGMKTPRPTVYITNVVKCRPPGNREPRSDEVAACSRYLDQQIAVIKPKVLVAVGGVAGCALLNLPPKSSGLRGRWHEHRGIPLRVIFHPSYLLRQRRSENDRTKADRETWNDIMEVMKLLQKQG